MLIGEYQHTLDAKNRLSLPAKFRKEVGSQVVVTRGLDTCLFVYPMAEWEKIAQKVSEMPFGSADSRSINRFLLSGAVEDEVDSVGRILIPDFLREFAQLQNQGQVIVAGVYTRLEIWDEKTWHEYKRRMEHQADALAEKLGDVGML